MTRLVAREAERLLTRPQLLRGAQLLIRVGQHVYRQANIDRRSGSLQALPAAIWSSTLDTIWGLKKALREELQRKQ